jgi:hypothetical protein
LVANTLHPDEATATWGLRRVADMAEGLPDAKDGVGMSSTALGRESRTTVMLAIQFGLRRRSGQPTRRVDSLFGS